MVYWAFSDRDAPNIVNAIWLFYAPIWILCNAMFGGIHGAPAWSFLPSVVMAVVGQNLILWLGARWIYLYGRRRTTKQAESNR